MAGKFPKRQFHIQIKRRNAKNQLNFDNLNMISKNRYSDIKLLKPKNKPLLIKPPTESWNILSPIQSIASTDIKSKFDFKTLTEFPIILDSLSVASSRLDSKFDGLTYRQYSDVNFLSTQCFSPIPKTSRKNNIFRYVLFTHFP